MDTGTGRFRHWAQCAVAVIVQRKKVVLKNSKKLLRSTKPSQIESVFRFQHLQQTYGGVQTSKAASGLHLDRFFFSSEPDNPGLAWI